MSDTQTPAPRKVWHLLEYASSVTVASKDFSFALAKRDDEWIEDLVAKLNLAEAATLTAEEMIAAGDAMTDFMELDFVIGSRLEPKYIAVCAILRRILDWQSK